MPKGWPPRCGHHIITRETEAQPWWCVLRQLPSRNFPPLKQGPSSVGQAHLPPFRVETSHGHPSPRHSRAYPWALNGHMGDCLTELCRGPGPSSDSFPAVGLGWGRGSKGPQPRAPEGHLTVCTAAVSASALSSFIPGPGAHSGPELRLPALPCPQLSGWQLN